MTSENAQVVAELQAIKAISPRVYEYLLAHNVLNKQLVHSYLTRLRSQDEEISKWAAKVTAKSLYPPPIRMVGDFETVCHMCYGKLKVWDEAYRTRVDCTYCKGKGTITRKAGDEVHCGFHSEFFKLSEETILRHSEFPPCLLTPVISSRSAKP